MSGGESCRIRVRGHLDDHWATWLGATVTREDDGTSTLYIAADQAGLHGLLAGLRDLGTPLLSLDVVSPPTPALSHAVRTDRLVLRPATADDADATWRYRRLPAVAEWLGTLPADLDAYRATFRGPGRLADTVIVETGGEVVGDLMLRIDDSWAQSEVAHRAHRTQAELGWTLDPRCTGRGYATEAARELVRICFAELAVHRVVATCFLANEASWRLMERIGMRRETLAHAESLHRSGAWLDTVGYAVTAPESARRP